MKDIEIGDMIKDVSGRMVQVYSFGHFQPAVKTKYLQIYASCALTTTGNLASLAGCEPTLVCHGHRCHHSLAIECRRVHARNMWLVHRFGSDSLNTTSRLSLHISVRRFENASRMLRQNQRSPER